MYQTLLANMLNHRFAISWCQWIRIWSLRCCLPFFLLKKIPSIADLLVYNSWQKKHMNNVLFEKKIKQHSIIHVWFGSVRLVAIYVLLLCTWIPLFICDIKICLHWFHSISHIFIFTLIVRERLQNGMRPYRFLILKNVKHSTLSVYTVPLITPFASSGK